MGERAGQAHDRAAEIDHSSLASAAFFRFAPSYFLSVRALRRVFQADFSCSSLVIFRALMRSVGLGMGMISLRVFCATFWSSERAVSPFLTDFLPEPFGKIMSFDMYSFKRCAFNCRLSVQAFLLRWSTAIPMVFASFFGIFASLSSSSVKPLPRRSFVL